MHNVNNKYLFHCLFVPDQDSNIMYLVVMLLLVMFGHFVLVFECFGC